MRACEWREDGRDAAARLVRARSGHNALPAPDALPATLPPRRLQKTYAVFMDRLVALLCRADVAGAVSQHSLPFLCAHPPPSQSLRSTLRWRR